MNRGQLLRLQFMRQPIAGIVPAMTKLALGTSFLDGRGCLQLASILSDVSTHGPASPSSARPCQPKLFSTTG